MTEPLPGLLKALCPARPPSMSLDSPGGPCMSCGPPPTSDRKRQTGRPEVGEAALLAPDPRCPCSLSPRPRLNAGLWVNPGCCRAGWGRSGTEQREPICQAHLELVCPILLPGRRRALDEYLPQENQEPTQGGWGAAFL